MTYYENEYQRAQEFEMYTDSARLCEEWGKPKEAEYWREKARSLYREEKDQKNCILWMDD